MTTKSADPLVANNPSAPANDADKVYVPAASFGVSWHDAVPVPLVVAVHVSAPFNVNTTGWPPTGAAVFAFVNTADTAVASPKSPVASATANAVGAAGAATVTVAAGELAGW